MTAAHSKKEGVPFIGVDSMPFAQAENPIMATVAMLASAVNPTVAAAAAQAALGIYF